MGAVACASSEEETTAPAVGVGPATSGTGATGGGASGGAGGAGGTGATGGGGEGGGSCQAGYPDPNWTVGEPEDCGFDAAGLEQAADVAAGLETQCMLVIRHGVIVGEWYFGSNDMTTPQKSFSIAKSYSSALVGIAMENGDLGGLDESVATHIPSWQGTDREPITLRNILSMTSGLEWSLWNDYVSMATFSQNHSEFAEGLAKSTEPGAEWVYNNGAVQLLEPIFRDATGDTIEAYAEEHLWSKIGMNATWAHDPSGNPTTYASVMASCREHAKFGYLYLHGGNWAGEQVVPAQHVADSLLPSQEMNRAYGYLWWLNGYEPRLDSLMQEKQGVLVPYAPADLFAARGFGNQFIDVIPSLDLVVVRFADDPTSSFDPAQMYEDANFDEHEAILAPILDALTDASR
jgi:CubicO group peptidase (beta-lactamase class C family)